MTQIISTASICVVCDNALRQEAAAQFATNHELPLLTELNSDYELQLYYNNDRIELYDSKLNTSIHVDFAKGALAHRQQFGGGRGQTIAKAIGLKHGNTPSVLDVTAGLARDAYILATLGCRITLIEHSPVLAELIADGIRRGLGHPESKKILAQDFDFINTDSIKYVKQLSAPERPDVIYIDPMYPERKKSALVKKDMQILQHLLGNEKNATELLETALGYAGKRVVVKRPIHAETLSHRNPNLTISSKKTRYDIYTIGRMG